MNPYHVLAKVTYGVGSSAKVEQRHYFVKAADHAGAVHLVESVLPITADSNSDMPDIQFTVKEAQEIRPPEQPSERSTAEIFAL